MKFSIIVPVYNVEKYIKDCLTSILNQTYDNFEVIVVNDGSPDNSEEIIKDLAKKDKRIKYFKKENGGISDTRNFGIEKTTGEYFLFVDSDDTIEKELLQKVFDAIDDETELVRFGAKRVNNKDVTYESPPVFTNLSGPQAFEKLINLSLFATVWSFAFKRSFWDKNKFKFAKGKVHEDFGLVPLVVMKANYVSAIEYPGYNYIIRENSIMTSNSLEKEKKKIDDTLYHYDYLLKEIDKLDIENKDLFKSYIANALINKAINSSSELRDSLMDEIIKRKVYKNLLSDTLKRKVKKTFFKTFPNTYISLSKKNK